MARILQVRDPELSVFQSAVDQVVNASRPLEQAHAFSASLPGHTRPGTDDPMIHQAASLALEIEARRAAEGTPVPDGVAAFKAARISGSISYCAGLALDLAHALFTRDRDEELRCRQELTAKFGSCDARYVQAAEQAAIYFGARKGAIPYVDFQNLSDFVIDDGQVTLPPHAKVAVIGDWGTGQPQALAVLQSLAAKKPDVVIHLGDVYYSGIEPEQQGYFFDPWCRILGLDADPVSRHVTSRHPATFSLAGNHDMYCGGAPYYKMIQQLGQRASFFCLRNDHWQFVGLDTGYFDHGIGGRCTRLAPRQPAWLKHKVDTREGRKTVLLSHHQLFSNEESFSPGDGRPASHINPLLMDEVQDVLASIDLWLCGHQHQFVAYREGPVKLRCIGHGAYPVGLSELNDPPAALPFALDPAIHPQRKGQAFFDNGYTLLELAGATATVTHFAVDEHGVERPDPSQERL